MKADNKLAERVPFNDLAPQWREIAREVKRDFDEVFAPGAFCLGPQVDAFQQRHLRASPCHGRVEYRPWR